MLTDAGVDRETIVLRRSMEDLREDFTELATIVASTSARLTRTLGELRRARGHVHAATLSAMEDEVGGLLCRYTGYRRELDALAGAAASPSRSGESLATLTRAKRTYADLIRTHQMLAGGLAVATDWQSPSFLHAGPSAAGRRTGHITEHRDDYRRDRHPDAAGFEEAFLHEYVDGRGDGLRALMTSCGMSAFVTILEFLRARRMRGPVVMGRSTYHECRDLLRRSGLGERIVEVDERDARRVIDTVLDLQADALFLDSLANARGVPVPALGTILGSIAERAARPVRVVIDNTCLSTGMQPFALVDPAHPRVRLIVFESLTKYAQLGLDRVTAGVILAPASDGEDLSDLREHLGTNVPDASVQAIPWPNRAALDRRLARLGRNAEILANHVHRHALARRGPVFAAALHPAQPHHPSFAIARDLWFRGGFFTLELTEGFDRAVVHRRFVVSAIRQAVRRQVPLVAGASFGLNTTRVYRTGSPTCDVHPFIRISAGTEHLQEVETLCEVFSAAMDEVAEASSSWRHHRHPLGRGRGDGHLKVGEGPGEGQSGLLLHRDQEDQGR